MPEDVRRALPDDEIVSVRDGAELARARDIEVAFAGNNAARVKQVLAAAPTLRWYHTFSAGVDTMLLPDFRERSITLTNNSGAYDVAIAEHVMAFVFAAAKRLHVYARHQAARTWHEERHDEVGDSTLVVYGMGSIGGEVARLAAAVGMRVIGVRRTAGSSSGVPRIVPPDALRDVAAETDYLVVAAPLTERTRGAVSRDVIARMKPTAWIVNIARGAIVDEAAMIEALRERRIAGAALDVFSSEPLPPDSELWTMENVIITPHSSSSSPRVRQRTLALFTENLRRYKAGEPLLNRVDFAVGY